MLLDRLEDHTIGAFEEGAANADRIAPMVLFLAWSTSRSTDADIVAAQVEATETIRSTGSLDSFDVFERARDFADAFYGREYFDIVRAIFGTAYPSLDDTNPKLLRRLCQHLDRELAKFRPDNAGLTPVRTLNALRAVTSLAHDGYAWSAAHSAFVRRQGHLRFALEVVVAKANRRDGETGVIAYPCGTVRDDRVDCIVQAIPHSLETESLYAPLHTRRDSEVRVPHEGKLAPAIAELVQRLEGIVQWLSTFVDERAVLAAYPSLDTINLLGGPDLLGPDPMWIYHRNLFAVAARLETLDQAACLFDAIGKRERYYRTQGSRKTWELCRAALSRVAT